MRSASGLRRSFEGLGCLGVVAVIMLVVGVLALLIELQSATAVLWTGQSATAHDRGGVGFFPYKGVSYTVIVPNEATTAPAPDITVYFDAKNPNLALVDSAATRWLDASFVAAPFTVGLAVMLAGLSRNRKRRRARLAAGPTGGFGHGFDPDELRARQARIATRSTDPPDSPA